MKLLSRADFVAEVRDAVTTRRPFATGKLGTSEKTWMYYEVFLATNPGARQRVAFEANLKFHAHLQSGVFPSDASFLREFGAWYVDHVRQLDVVGLFRDRPSLEDGVISHYRLANEWVFFEDQEPDRSSPARDDLCYLPAFRGTRVLIVCPFAELLRARATEDTFEAVWAKTGKRWFAPASVDALEFPYGYDPDTERRFGTAFSLHDRIVEDMAGRDFDVALIAAGGLGIPLASAVRSLGKIGLSLGGHLQVLFGVLGKRWREQQDWQANYVNDAWIEMPGQYRPQRSTQVSDGGAYW